MKFAIVSDTHDNIKNFNKVIDWLNGKKIELILHCGDICNQETINEAVKNFKGSSFAKATADKGIKFVRGNGDFELDSIPEKMDIELGGNPSTGFPSASLGAGRARKIFFNHYPDIARKMAESGKYDLVFYGHTHKPWLEEVGKCRLINPGELAGQRFKPTFAVYDTDMDKLELKILEKI